MAEARNLKAREYYTNVFQHDVTPYGANPSSIRTNNTYKSEAFNTSLDPRITQHGENKRAATFKERPLTAQVTRGYNQDSNIFGYKEQNPDTYKVVKSTI
jgi:hypothetical protein